MGNVIHVGKLTPQRIKELEEVKRIAETSPDLVLIAPSMRHALGLVQEWCWLVHGQRFEYLDEILDWLNKRDPPPDAPTS